MKTPQLAASLLVMGTLDATDWPELRDEDFTEEVRRRLTEVGLELTSGAGRWLARPVHPQDADGFVPAFRLHTVELAMVAALYLHLRYLPRQNGLAEPADEPSVDAEEFLRSFPAYDRQYLSERVLGHLRNAGFVRREAGRLYAGPYLSAIDEIAADERAKSDLRDFVLRRFLQRRVQELESDASD